MVSFRELIKMYGNVPLLVHAKVHRQYVYQTDPNSVESSRKTKSYQEENKRNCLKITVCFNYYKRKMLFSLGFVV